MIVRTYWPGATIDDTMLQITDRIEKKLQETPSLYYLKSETKPGVSTIYVNVLDSTPKEAIPDIWYQVRKKVADIKSTLPQGILGPSFNDEFGDVFGIIYAFTADGFTHRELRDYVERIRTQILTIKNAAKAQLIGAQDQKFYLEFDTHQLAGLGVSRDDVISSLQEQNAVTPSGVVQTGLEKYAIRVSGAFSSVDDLKRINLYANGKFFRLADVASISKGYSDPPQPMFRFNGEPAIGLAISMAQGGNNLVFGEAVAHKMEQIIAKLPIGIEAHLVADQPVVVEEAVGGFTKALWEAIAIVLAVSFVSLGMRAGVVVACSIPLVLGMVFAYMEYSGISLQRISLGALIISLGLLVDDAMITIEMMVSQLEAGVDREHSATHAWVTTAFPMLTGTLVTVAGFVPIGFAKSGAGEYCYSLFAVIAVALLASWIVAVMFAPVIGVTILPKTMKAHGGGHGEPGRLMRLFRAALHLLHARPVARYRGHRRAVCRLIVRIRVHPAAILPGLGPAGAGRRSKPASGFVDIRDRARSRAVRGAAEGRPEYRALQSLCRARGSPFLSAVERAIVQRLFRAGGHRDQGHCGARNRPGASAKGARHGIRQPQYENLPAGTGTARRLAVAIPRQRPDPGRHPRRGVPGCPNDRAEPEYAAHQFRLERADEEPPLAGRSGPGPPARRQFQVARRGSQRRHQRNGRHPGPRLDLSDRPDGAGHRAATRLGADFEKSASRAGQRADDPAEPSRNRPI